MDDQDQNKLQNMVGNTVERVEINGEGYLEIFLSDGSRVGIGVGGNYERMYLTVD